MEPTVFSDAYPPRNRKVTDSLSVVQVEIVGGAGVTRVDLNQVAMYGYGRELPFGDPLPDVPSMLTGQAPAYIVRTFEVEMALAPRELLALWRRELSPEQFFKLRDAFGIFFEIHDDFYDDETGQAFQPMSDTYPD